MVRRYAFIACLGILIGSAGIARSYFRLATAAADMTASADKFLGTLEAAQKEKVVMAYDAPQRVDWHFIPKDARKGLQIKEMNEAQRSAALGLLRASLSQVGYDKATKIMNLENVLKTLESTRTGGPLRDAERYYFTIFGQPSDSGRWGLSVEGHHLSLNFVVEGDKVVSSTPTVFATNPAVMMSEVAGVAKGTRLLADEEILAFDLVKSLTEEQRGKAILAPEAPKEVRAAGEAQPPTAEAEGVTYAELDEQQRGLLRRLVESYARNLPEDVAKARLTAIRDGGPSQVHFAWAGATEPGIGHYYKIQGPSFLIEFVNTQPDAAGNPANHIHCLWRDMQGDFALPVSKK